MSGIFEQKLFLDRQIQFRLDKISEHQEALKELRKQRAMLYVDGGEMAYVLLSAKEKAAFDKLPFSDDPCEYCDRPEVKVGNKKSICKNCGHLNPHKKLSKPKEVEK